MVDEMDLLSRVKDTPAPRAEAYEAARATLRAALAAEASPQAESPAPSVPARGRPRAARSMRGAAVALAAVAAAAAAVVLVITSASPATPHHPATSGGHPAVPTVHPQLARLADYLTVRETRLPGNASLEIRNQSATSSAPGANGVDLLTDGGTYYWALTRSGLPQAIADHEDPSGGAFRREVSIATYAVHGSLATARARMAVANFAPGIRPHELTPGRVDTMLRRRDRLMHLRYTPPKPLTPAQEKESTDNSIWMNSLDALNAGAGNPLVRAGVFRIMSTMPRVTIARTTTAGQPTLTLTDTWPASGPLREVLVINARTGLPVISLTRQPGQAATGVTYYHVFRVTLARIAAGRP